MRPRFNWSISSVVVKLMYKNHRYISREIQLLSACALLVATGASAQPGNDDNALVEQIVTTAQRIETDGNRHRGSISQVSEAELSLVSPVHIQETLARVPGVNLNRGEGMEYLPAIRSPVLTGAGACGGFLMAQDGIPLRSAGFCNINELFEAHTEAARSIEVLRGPGTALHGSNALHGIVNVITEAADDSQLGIEAGPDDYSRVKVRTAVGEGNSRLGIHFSSTHDGGYRDASGFDQSKLTLRHSWSGDQWQADSGLTATHLEQETAGYITGNGAYKVSALARSNPNPDAYRDAQSLRLWSKWSREDDQGNRWLITPYARYTDMDFRMHFVPGTPIEENGQTSIGLLSTYVRALSDSVQWTSGVDLEYTQGFLKEVQDAPTEGSAFLRATIPQGLHYDYDVDAMMIAPYAQLDVAINEHWSLTAGLRYEWMEYDYTNQMLTGRTDDTGTSCGFGGCRFSRPPSSTDRFENLSPKLAISYQISPQTMAYASLARGFRAPQATEMYRLQRAQTAADLDSEELDSLEIGLKASGVRFSYQLAAFWMHKDNYIFRDASYFNVSDGETAHRGIEFGMHVSLAQKWSLNLASSYAEHKYRYDELVDEQSIRGNLVDSAPRFFGNLRLKWRPGASVSGELEWQHMGAYYLDPANDYRYPGHNVVNARARWSVNNALNLYARVLNVTDREYAERADYTTFTGERYFPGRPRSLYVGVEWKWR